MAQVFLVIEFIMRLFRIYDDFMAWSDQKRSAELEERKQKRDAAVNEQQKPDITEEEFDRLQKVISDSLPRP